MTEEAVASSSSCSLSGDYWLLVHRPVTLEPACYWSVLNPFRQTNSPGLVINLQHSPGSFHIDPLRGKRINDKLMKTFIVFRIRGWFLAPT